MRAEEHGMSTERVGASRQVQEQATLGCKNLESGIQLVTEWLYVSARIEFESVVGNICDAHRCAVLFSAS